MPSCIGTFFFKKGVWVWTEMEHDESFGFSKLCIEYHQKHITLYYIYRYA